MTYEVTPVAEAQIDQLYRKSRRTWGAQHARDYVDGLDLAVREIVADPSLARPRPEAHPDLRVRPYRAHML